MGENLSIEYLRGFNDALNLVFDTYNRLGITKKIPEKCKECKVINEISKLFNIAQESYLHKVQGQLMYINALLSKGE